VTIDQSENPNLGRFVVDEQFTTIGALNPTLRNIALTAPTCMTGHQDLREVWCITTTAALPMKAIRSTVLSGGTPLNLTDQQIDDLVASGIAQQRRPGTAIDADSGPPTLRGPPATAGAGNDPRGEHTMKRRDFVKLGPLR
jgi:hypothetical protein